MIALLGLIFGILVAPYNFLLGVLVAVIGFYIEGME